jgi:pilus assembly protein CpaE
VNRPAFREKHVLVIGPALAALAEQALGGALLEVAGLEREGALSALRPGLDLVIVDADAAAPDLCAGAVEAARRHADPPAMLLVGARLPTALVHALLKLPRSDVLESPASEADLARAVAGLTADSAPAPAPGRASRCWTVMGSVGGAGATTLAIEIAASLARRAAQPGLVALVDLNLAFGAAHAYLGAAANMRLAEASSSPDRIDAAILDAFAVRVEAGFDLLAAPRDPMAFDRVAPAAVLRTLEMACQSYDAVIVDLPRWRHAWSLDVLAGSDEVLIVSELTVPALLQARAFVCEIEDEAPGARRPRLILNRMSGRAFGPAPSRAEAEKALGRKVDGAITSDWEAAACSVNLGGPISQHRPRSKIVKDVVGLVDKLLAHGQTQGAGTERPTRAA